MYRGVKRMNTGQHLAPSRGSHRPMHPTTGTALDPHSLEPPKPQSLDVGSMGPYQQAMMQTKLPKAPRGIGLPRAPRGKGGF